MQQGTTQITTYYAVHAQFDLMLKLYSHHTVKIQTEIRYLNNHVNKSGSEYQYSCDSSTKNSLFLATLQFLRKGMLNPVIIPTLYCLLSYTEHSSIITENAVFSVT